MNNVWISDIQKFSIHDGRGIRTTVFFKGCPLRCAWCHNPETQSFKPELFFYRERCVGCEECATVCLHEGFREREKCIGCGACVDSCYHGAREMCGKGYTPQRLVDEIMKDQPFYETSDGGVTLSGGEVLSQDMDYILTLVKMLKEREVSVNIDTCGMALFEKFEKMIPYVDTFLYDIKLMENELHKKFTGVDNELILSNFIRLIRKKAKVWLRLPIIGGVNDNLQHGNEILHFLIKNDLRPEHIHLLPYHDIGMGKYERLGMQYVNDFYVPNDVFMDSLKKMFEENGFQNVYIGG